MADLPPIPYRIAIAPFQEEADAAQGGGLRTVQGDGLDFVYAPSELQRIVARRLDAFHTATEIFCIDAAADPNKPNDVDPYLWQAIQHRADLLVRAKVVVPPQLACEGWSGRWPVATGFTAFTGPGQNWVESVAYQARLGVEFTVESPHYVHPIAVVVSRLDRQDLDHWDRHAVVSFATLASILVPSFLLWDDKATTEQALSDRMCEALAARLAKVLKKDLSEAQNQFLGELRLDTPANGATVSARIGEVPVRGKILARHPIHALELWVDDEERPRVKLGINDLPDATDQRRIEGYEVVFDHTLKLAVGAHTLQVEMVIRGQRTSRTVALKVTE